MMNMISRHDIDDNEIRIITSQKEEPVAHPVPPRKPKRRYTVPAIIVLAAIVAFLIWICGNAFWKRSQHQSGTGGCNVGNTAKADSISKAFVEISDTTIHGVSLTVLRPVGGTPTLAVGPGPLADTAAVLVMPAADVRSDNGAIVGAYVVQGQLLSKGYSKSGFCAIIGGTPIIGVADATPYLEQALESGGYFFRQYPLVVGGQVVENKPKGKAQRKALAELSGRVVVIVSGDRQTFHDFSQALVDLGVTNAIYLVGADAYGFAKDDSGTFFPFGEKEDAPLQNTNYIVWR